MFKIRDARGKSVTLILLLNLLAAGFGVPCKERRFGQDNVVCVCTAEYCDDPGPSPDVLLQNDTTKFLHYISTADGKRFQRNEVFFAQEMAASVSVTFDVVMKRRQEIIGFGCAITDSVGINLYTLKNSTQEKLMRQYFGPGSIGYSFIRIPLGGTDFSPMYYSYDDFLNDVNLTHFSLADEDFLFKIPYIQMALNLSDEPVKILTTSWSAPNWMKEQRTILTGFTKLQDQYYGVYAEYIIKCLDAYREQGIEFWGITPQNEPSDGLLYYMGFNSMGWTAEEQVIWIRDHLGPALHKHGYGDIKLILFDDMRSLLKDWAAIVLKDNKVRNYSSGIAIHWYTDYLDSCSQDIMDEIHKRFPELFLLYSEASIVHQGAEKPVDLGNWQRGERYASSILHTLEHSVVGWIDWNLALNLEGGPTWAHNNLDAAIIINASAQEFYKQPMFYAIAHFSYFLPPGSHRIEMSLTSKSDRNIEYIAFHSYNNNTVIVLLNRNHQDETAAINIPQKGIMEIYLPAHSFHTLVYKSNEVPTRQNSGLQHHPSPLYIVLLTSLLFLK